MKEIKLDVQSRTENDKISELRLSGYIPATFYGAGISPLKVKVGKKEFQKVYSEIGKLGLINLNIDGKDTFQVLVKDIQQDIIKGDFVHVDFFKVNMDKKITNLIPLHFINESRAVKELGGNLIKTMEFLKIKCLPKDLISGVDIDLSEIKNIDEAIRVRDLKLNPAIEVLTSSTNVIVNVLKPKVVEKGKPQKAEKK